VAYGEADRRWGVATTVDTRFGIASGTKTFTALTVMSLVDDGILDLTTTARSLLGADLPLIDDAVTIEHLLDHTSGIGDYFDEDVHDDATAYVLPVPVHTLDCTEAYLQVLDGFPQRDPPGTRFAYNNGGYVVLALLAERAAATPFPDLVAQRACAPAQMTSTEFLRADELPPGAATGYLDADGLRTNVLHLPVRGSGDGGIYSTAADIHALWRAFSPALTVRRGETYGLGVWVESSGAFAMEGSDAGVSFRSAHDPATGTTATVLSNTTDGAWPIARLLRDLLAPLT
jgi:CubicO group peptidase (beta-lactamase class C family)